MEIGLDLISLSIWFKKSIQVVRIGKLDALWESAALGR
jgi:hypothetical protein